MTKKFSVHGRKMTDTERTRRWKQKNPDKVRDMAYRSRYGISYSEVMLMIEEQNYCCAICLDSLDMGKHTHVDHCHNSNRVRGVLCNLCNTAIGKLKDSPTILRRAVDYLER